MPRPRKTEKEKKQDISIKADPAVVEAVEEIAFDLELPISLVGRKLIARGLAAYQRDRMLDEPRAISPVAKIELRVNEREKAQPEKKVKAKG